MASEFKPNEAGLTRFQREIDAQFARINARVQARLGKKATIDEKVNATVYEFSKIGVEADKKAVRARYEDLAHDPQGESRPDHR